MSELLFEIFCEEIPARMQPKAEADLERLLGEKLTAAGLAWSSLTTFAGPRRLGLAIDGLPVKTQDVREERKGPRVGAPDKAVEGFLRGAGVDSLDACETREDKKGEFWVAIIEKPGRATAEVIAEAIPEVMKAFPWPKSMKFGEDGKAQRWVRPIQRLLCLFDGQVVDFEVFGIRTGNLTEGHRRMGRGPFEITDFAQYTKVLREKGHVIQQREEREAIILEGARTVCAEAGLELVEDPGLLTEVAGLVEWPVPLLGEMDPDFLDLPPEVITLTMKTHQKYFAVKKPGEAGVTSKFVVIANQLAPDGGKAIAAGNARVLSARLSDARHFWDVDQHVPPEFGGEVTPLSNMVGRLEDVTFHAELGTVEARVDRLTSLSKAIGKLVGADEHDVWTAAHYAKADLVSQMVYEFPELQGVIGRYYALAAGEATEVADAIRDHYKPQGPSDIVPSQAVSIAVALADKLDALFGFWLIGEKPTGSKDPFALRRAALGVIRIALENGLKLPLSRVLEFSGAAYREQFLAEGLLDLEAYSDVSDEDIDRAEAGRVAHLDVKLPEIVSDLLAFFADRLKVHLRDEGIRYDVIDAVFALGDDDLVRVTAKARALQAFLDTEDGAALLAGYNRASNIVRAEEKKDGEGAFEGELEAGYLAAAPEDQESALIAAVNTVKGEAQQALVAENFEAAMAALATLRAPIDAFFEHVTVNSEDAALRRNRLFLLSQIRTAVRAVADFDRIAG
ncbi:glycine--tRNA ligase subunit beta [Maricaulis virginensis]|uniref:Glycine--tRNA ligase beta subunit n=1 Tax=Maricaulis virginensis TaxID=144022 RepID=A0A9W6MQB3_9PROT|nr:glycine--tRNA ligase subunit beta [Maricaulis virginensis]GLK53786.1 glycine--tRNA ligase beta subunit [Maricaulis virginensis]